ncbi:hypothetical protein Fmac_024977 [Flemingia macrophylla]|uniref:Uncharacterized protein n=1 Tax=Flemingia macrophylla TaxID=520843 RepID=A0ABD1LQX1_9FABA
MIALIHYELIPSVVVPLKQEGPDFLTLSSTSEAQRAINDAHVEVKSVENGIGVVRLISSFSAYNTISHRPFEQAQGAWSTLIMDHHPPMINGTLQLKKTRRSSGSVGMGDLAGSLPESVQVKITHDKKSCVGLWDQSVLLQVIEHLRKGYLWRVVTNKEVVSRSDVIYEG